MKHRYITESIIKRILQQIVDLFVDIYSKLFKRKDISRDLSEPKSILIVALAHLGDALICSYIFPLIRERYKDVQIDVLTGEWCSPILENNPYVRSLIFYNHYRMNRSHTSRWKKFLSHIKSSHSALKKIRNNKYDISIEGRISHPNGNLITYRGRVKRRIGFGSGGFGSLLTDEVPLPIKKNFHMLDALLEELKLIDIKKILDDIKPYFSLSNQSIQMANQIADDVRKPFIILHVETGKDYLPERLINESFWLEIVRIILGETALNVIVCGTTDRSKEFFEFLQSNLINDKARLINAVQKLSLDEFFFLNGQAIASITVDSLAAHFCSINCNTISFFKNGFGALYFPISNKTTVVIHNQAAIDNLAVHPNLILHQVDEIESPKSLSIFLNQFKKLV